MSARTVLAALALLGLLSLLTAGCSITAPRGGWYAAAAPTLSCKLKLHDHACVACAKVNCCAETQACEPDARCSCLLKCANGPWAFTECLSDERCGPANDLYRAERACLSAHCPNICPKEHGGPPP